MLDALDILIVAYLMYRIYKLLSGSLAFNIFIGFIFIYFAWWLVRILEMDLLSTVLNQFVNLGVIIAVIIFQPEIRRFLLMLGQGASNNRSIISRFFKQHSSSEYDIESINHLIRGIDKMSKNKTGALIVFADNISHEIFSNTGIDLGAQIKESTILSIFNKQSPLHDGAMLLSNGKIQKASCVLPLTKKDQLPQHYGLRHRAAIGATEEYNVTAIIVSEESGTISIAEFGQLKENVDIKYLKNKLVKNFVDSPLEETK